jgi:eukaryotic-like serine/threonine-protein kinase
MSDLQQRLQAALGGAYQIERELGGGGMSRVFVAHETALGRQVVIKVLPPDMAASVNIERFRREIQLAASLQHPHIVPVHAAAQVGDLFYYTMPLVEGESLRTRLARDGELPVGDAIRILQDVADGLAYAHAHGVVHRDIKPDNILISGNHAVVTDFGVAKAVSAAAGESSLTSIGVALGTPAYMSPEQASADPHVDHRADIYAVGAMAYEMLTGQPPFTGMSAQQVLAAHITTAPVPVTSRRPSVSPALNQLVMQCLEKKPADRVQHATELLALLQAIATPSGGMAPSGATPAMTSGAAAAMRRAHPVRVALVFGLASIAILAGVLFLRTMLGLPDWVIVAAAFLLLLGLPIILGTARMERTRLRAMTTGAQLPPRKGIARLFTWRLAIAGGVAAFTALAIVVVGYTAMRAAGIGSIGTLQAKGLIKEKQPILLAEFENRSSDTTLGPTLTEAFRVDLSQSQSVKLVGVDAVADALTRMQRSSTTVLTPPVAREVAEREGIPAVVVGEIDPVGKSFVISVNVVSASNGAVLTAVRETAANDAELIPALDRLSRAVRERIGESLVSIRADEPLAHVTTSSLNALRKYSEALRLVERGREDLAIPLLEEATALDTSFAMAWRKLGVLRGNAGSFQKQVDALTRAYRHRDRLPELERQATIGSYSEAVDYNPSKAIAAFRAMLAIDPDNDIALNNLASDLFDARQYAEGETLAVRCVRNGVLGNCPFHAMRLQLAQNKVAEAESTMSRWERAAPRDPTVLDAQFMFTSALGDYASAERYARKVEEQQGTSAYWRETAAREAAALAGVRGNLSLAEQKYRNAAQAAEDGGDNAGYLRYMSAIARMHAQLRDRPADALAVLASALAKHPLTTLEPIDRPYSQLASAYAYAGRPEEGQRLLAEYAREVPPGQLKTDFFRHEAAGDVAFARGNYTEAINDYRALRAQIGCPDCDLFEIGSSFARLNQPDSARTYYESFLASSGANRVNRDVFIRAAAFQRLGELYEARGDRAKAREYYLKLTDLWKNADPELQPIVRDAHARIARLSAEH